MEKKVGRLNKNLAVALGLGIGAATVVAVANQAQAMPSFARQYKVECSTCHTHMPERNAFGEAFERNSFIWPSTKKPAATQSANEAIMLSGIPEELPVSFYARVGSSYNSENTDDGNVNPKFDFGNGGSFEMFVAGNFREKVGFMADAGFDTDGANTSNVWLAFKEPGHVPLDIKLGTFSPNMSVLSMTRHTAAQGYVFHNTAAIAPTGGSITSRQPTLELSRIFGNQVFAALGVQNNKSAASDNQRTNSVASYGALSWRIIGTDLYGNQPEVSLSAAESFTDYLTLSLGGWGITGSQHEAITSNLDDNEYDRYGVDLEAYYKAWRLRMTTAWGTEKNPMMSAAVPASAALNPATGAVVLTPARAAVWGPDRDLISYHALLEYMINSDWLVGAAYNYMDIDQDNVVSLLNNDSQVNMSLSASYLFYQNVRLQAAYVHDSFQPVANQLEYGNRDVLSFTAFFAM